MVVQLFNCYFLILLSLCAVECHLTNKTLRTNRDLPEIKDGEACTPGKSYKMECNTCWCSNSGNLICSKMACMVWPTHTHNQYWRSNKGLEELPRLDCEPGMFYRKGCQRCFCTIARVAVCTRKLCKKGADTTNSILTPADVRPAIDDAEFENLPKVLHGADDCNPGGTYRWDCNICICLVNGNLLCEQNYCLHMGETNRLAAKKKTGNQCKSHVVVEDECVRCKCEKSGHYSCTPLSDCVPVSARRQLHGSHERLKPRMLFNLENDKCIPHVVYKFGCNNCYCQEDHSLRCTRKGCLNKEQVEQLIKPGDDDDDTEDNTAESSTNKDKNAAKEVN